MNIKIKSIVKVLLVDWSVAIPAVLLVHNQLPLVGVGMIFLAELWQLLKIDRQEQNAWKDGAFSMLVRLGLMGLLALIKQPVGIAVIGAVFLTFRLWWKNSAVSRPTLALGGQFILLWVGYLLAAVVKLPLGVTLAWSWVVGYVCAAHFLRAYDVRARAVIAASWALVSLECGWFFSVWLVNYILPYGVFVIPQPALVMTALGYSLGGIYKFHHAKNLTRARLIEYLVICLVALAIVISGTNWKGAV